jgi:hypothetical protein
MVESTKNGAIMTRWLVRAIEAALITITLAAVCQELEKPEKERRWHGKLGLVPYDFRVPTLERAKQAFWNEEEEERIFTKPVFGVGWGINFYALLEKMRIIGDFYLTEEDFLMPTESLRKILEKRPPATEETFG